MSPTPQAILDAKAQELYEAHCGEARKRGWDWNPFNGSRIKPLAWDRLDNNTREVWRGKALLSLRSEETLADELRRHENDVRASRRERA